MSDEIDPHIQAMIDEFVADPKVGLSALIARCSTLEEEQVLRRELMAALSMEEYFNCIRVNESLPKIDLDPKRILLAALQFDMGMSMTRSSETFSLSSLLPT
ncbi:MAG: hypothetical protein KBC48_00160 [Candidatus Pacebacteria bacterium]|nr:hypothetical protein [Candidatus Paceibacterota bacterium]